jgi:enediyne biosynthesis protein E4
MLIGSAVPRTAFGSPASVSVVLSPVGSTSVSQGSPFWFWAEATNSDPEPIPVWVDFGVQGPQGPGFNAYRWSVTIPGMETVLGRFSVTSGQWFESTGSFTVTPLVLGVPAGDPIAFEVTAPTVVAPVFEDVTGAAGLDTVLPDADCYRLGAGAAWGDAEGDGDLDLYVPGQGVAQLWIQDRPGHFVEQAAARGVDNGARIGMGAVFTDDDRDGDQDLYVTNDGPNRLYRNDGTGHFVDVAPEAGVADDGAGPSASWGDYDNDGLLDLYVTNYVTCETQGQPDKLYHNEGDGHFSDETALLEATGDTSGVGFEAAWFDYDGDGDQDLYLANDRLSLAIPGNHLWRNDGPGEGGTWVFTDVSEDSGTDWVMASMGLGVADFDRDLDLDFAISNIEGNVLARNNGDGTFDDVAAAARVERPFQNAEEHAITWGLGFFDFNLDGWEDLYVAAGTIYGDTPQPNEMFVADRHGRFLDLSALSQADDPGVSRGVAFADYDGDGLVDLYVVNQSGRPRLYHNITSISGSHWLEVDTVGTTSNTDGCGARILVTAASARMLREVFCGSVSLSAGSDSTVHFGLGSATVVSKLVVLWPSGVRQVLRNVPADQRLTLVEP